MRAGETASVVDEQLAGLVRVVGIKRQVELARGGARVEESFVEEPDDFMAKFVQCSSPGLAELEFALETEASSSLNQHSQSELLVLVI